MSNFIIQLGIINRKLSIPFLLALFLLLNALFNAYFLEEYQDELMDNLISSLAQISIIILPKFKKFSSKREKLIVERKNATKACSHFFILFVLVVGTCVILNMYLNQSKIPLKKMEKRKKIQLKY